MTTTRRHVLIFGINYWPEELGIAPYTTGLAEHLATQGDDVTVVTGFPHYPQWRTADGDRFSRSRTEMINGVRVIRQRHYVPSRPSAPRRGLYELTFLAHSLLSDIKTRPDVILGVSPSVSGAMLASLASSRYRVPYGLWFQDLSGRAASQSGISGGRSVAQSVEMMEAFAARRAARVAVIANGFRQQVEMMGVDPNRIDVIRNWSHIAPPTLSKEECRRKLGLPEDAFVCLHAGNMGQKQGLENVIEAARLSADQPGAPLFVLQGDGNTREALVRLAAGLPNVRFLPPQPHDDFPNTLAAADVLLVNQKPTITDMCLPGKLTSYFAAERPVVAAVHQESETALELRNADAGLVVRPGDSAALLAGVSHLRTDEQAGSILARNGRQFAETHLLPASAFTSIELFIERASVPRHEFATQPGLLQAEGD